MGLAESPVRTIDLRCLERWEANRRNPPLRHMGVDELYQGKPDKFLKVVCNLETAEPLWFGKERKKETLVNEPATEADQGSLGGPVGAVSAEHRAVGAELPDHLRQVPHHAARQGSGG
jgi:hypothetical protein